MEGHCVNLEEEVVAVVRAQQQEQWRMMVGMHADACCEDGDKGSCCVA
jgi:hypothetical protein